MAFEELKVPPPPDHQLFSLAVTIIEGPASERFQEENPVVSRSIQIRGDQTLGDLHKAIFDAFDREDDTLYQFQIGGEERNDPTARYFAHTELVDSPLTAFDDLEYAERSRLASLHLRVGDAFGYWFGFGDGGWLHRVDVLEAVATPPRDGFPKVTARVGASPPQHMDPKDREE